MALCEALCDLCETLCNPPSAVRRVTQSFTKITQSFTEVTASPFYTVSDAVSISAHVFCIRDNHYQIALEDLALLSK